MLAEKLGLVLLSRIRIIQVRAATERTTGSKSSTWGLRMSITLPITLTSFYNLCPLNNRYNTQPNVGSESCVTTILTTAVQHGKSPHQITREVSTRTPNNYPEFRGQN